jgi:hypothetical protein
VFWTFVGLHEFFTFFYPPSGFGFLIYFRTFFHMDVFFTGFNFFSRYHVGRIGGHRKPVNEFGKKCGGLLSLHYHSIYGTSPPPSLLPRPHSSLLLTPHSSLLTPPSSILPPPSSILPPPCLLATSLPPPVSNPPFPPSSLSVLSWA